MLKALLKLFGFNSSSENDDKGQDDSNKFVLYSPDYGESIAVSNSNISYKTDLIKNLKYEHELLFKMFTGIMESLEQKQFGKAERLLSNFVEQLRHHIHIENRLLYIFLKDMYRAIPDKQEYITEMQKKMGKIVMGLKTTTEKYPEINASNCEELEKDLTGIAAILTERISNEEKILYEMYSVNPGV